MRLELRHLRILCAIADAGSVTKAAANLGLAQPALAAQLKRIERAIGRELFDRGRHGARPTPLGELVLTRARLLLPAVQGLEEDATHMAAQHTQPASYRIGAVNGPILSGLIRRLDAEHPDTALSIHMSWSCAELAERLGSGHLDYAVVGVCGHAAPPGLATLPGSGPQREPEWRTIAVDPVFVLLAEHHPLAARADVELCELAGSSWAMTRGDGCFGECFASACAKAGFAVHDLYEGDVRTCVELVESGIAVAVCQASFRPPPGVVSVPLAGVPLRWRHLLGWLPGAPADQHAERVFAHAVAAYEEAVARTPRYARWLASDPRFGVAGREHGVAPSMNAMT